MRTTGHCVLITGGASGIGLALAQRFHAAGNRVIIVGRGHAALERAAAMLPGVVAHVADVAAPAERRALATQFPEVSVLVNNAGIQHNGTLLEAREEMIEQELDVNFLAPVLLCQAFLPRLLAQREAAIVNVSSALAIVPKESAPIYCASKAALHSFSKTLRWQLEGSGVRVFEMLPPLVDTAMTAGRGRGKLTPAAVAAEFWAGFAADKLEMRIGKAALLHTVNRLAPRLAERIIRSTP